MKRNWLVVMMLFILVVSTACGKEPNNRNNAVSSPNSNGADTITYQSEQGPIQVPANPERIVALTNAPNVLALGGTLVGVDQWSKKNPLFTKKLEEVEIVSGTDLERITAQNPDLIIVGAELKNIAEMSKIAPTVVYTWGKNDYLTQHLEIGRLINKEDEARAWIDDFEQRAAAVGNEIKAQLGDAFTVSVFETDGKSFYVFGDKWARGTEILYQTMKLQMPDSVKKDALGSGYYTLSQEVLPEYAGDYIVLSRDLDSEASFMDSEIWQRIPAVQNNRVIEIDTKASTYSDPITLEHLLSIFKTAFLGEN
ncbi:ABC transporter substrate-binding protein [Ammoniphilus oxalaticus]|uniref:ABC transporter substrate-binding protein n=1 Tax=Ammoniphilus oxalaticus TaxID=66863 RepID=A0A419SKI1_9BACL|nr:iron-hydroxamate ABC transporter substrate-binding protein [Ammoniphilus oxalaticus]RKD24524.1 ABC transporter substrate-binding protein [Ammoniphilus oxalaticus]